VAGTAVPKVQRANEEFGYEHPAETSSLGSPPLPASQPMLRGLPSRRLAEQQGILSTTTAWARAGAGTEKESAVKPDELSDQTTPDTMGRHPDGRIHGSRQCSLEEPDRQIWDKAYTY